MLIIVIVALFFLVYRRRGRHARHATGPAIKGVMTTGEEENLQAMWANPLYRVPLSGAGRGGVGDDGGTSRDNVVVAGGGRGGGGHSDQAQGGPPLGWSGAYMLDGGMEGEEEESDDHAHHTVTSARRAAPVAPTAAVTPLYTPSVSSPSSVPAECRPLIEGGPDASRETLLLLPTTTTVTLQPNPMYGFYSSTPLVAADSPPYTAPAGPDATSTDEGEQPQYAAPTY